jgi:hypothetical protein
LTDSVVLSECHIPISGPNELHQAAALPQTERTRRPPNAFILFGKEWRKKVAAQFPLEKNKNISVR